MSDESSAPTTHLLTAKDVNQALVEVCEQLFQRGVPGVGIATLQPRARWLVRVGVLENISQKAQPNALEHETDPERTLTSGTRLRCFAFPDEPGAYLVLQSPRIPPDMLELCLEVAGALLKRRRLERRQRALMFLLQRSRSRQRTLRVQVDAARSQARHDLKAPLTAFQGYVDLIGRGLAGPVSPTLERYLERMRDAANRENLLIDHHLGRRAH